MIANLPAFLRRVLEIAAAEVGVHEDAAHTNHGARVEEYLACAGLPPGNPWCAAFVYWCFEQAAREFGIENPLVKTGYCPTILNWGHKVEITHQQPQPGDLFLVFHVVNGVRRVAHVGFVRSVVNTGWSTIEGNSNDDGSREGYEVCVNARLFAPRYIFVRVADLPAVQAATKPVATVPPQLCVYLPGVQAAFKLSSAVYKSNTWFVDGEEVQGILRNTAHRPCDLTGRNTLREYLLQAGLGIDEARTLAGNHLDDLAQPRQFVFVKVGNQAGQKAGA